MARASTILRTLAVAATAALAIGLAGCEVQGGNEGEPSAYVTEGKLTIGTGEPAYYPWVIDDAPESGEGYEAAVAYAVAEELGFDAEDVVWVRTTFDEAIAPGAKNFDFNLQQFSITDERKQNVDFSTPYYETTQVVITNAASRGRRRNHDRGAQGLPDRCRRPARRASRRSSSIIAARLPVRRCSTPTMTRSSRSSPARSTRSWSTSRPRSTSRASN